MFWFCYELQHLSIIASTPAAACVHACVCDYTLLILFSSKPNWQFLLIKNFSAKIFHLNFVPYSI